MHFFKNIYRKPEYNPESVEYMSQLTACLTKFCNTKTPCIITGDLNCPGIDWVSNRSPPDNIQDKFQKFCTTNGFAQYVEDPTRLSNILDVLLVNEPAILCEVTVGAPFTVKCDHSCVNFSLSLNVFCADNTTHRSTLCDSHTDRFYLWRKADFLGMSNYLSQVNWLQMLTVNLEPNALWKAFRDILYDAIDRYVPSRPERCMQTRVKSHYPPKIKRAIARKSCLWRKLKSDPSNDKLAASYKNAESRSRALLSNYELKLENDVINSNNIGSFYNFINKRLTRKSGIGALSIADGEFCTDELGRANILNDYFSSVCTVDNGLTPVIDSLVDSHTRLDHIEFNPDNVMRAIKKLKANSASGVDGLPPLIYKNLAPYLAEPLALIFESFLSVGCIPDEWRHAIVTPVYKGGISSAVTNYRPISLTCVACKIMERVIVCQMLHYLRKHCLLSSEQYGFLTKRSTTLNLLDALNDWTIAVDNKFSVTIAYIDYAKAFDTVSPTKLCRKLEAFGISGDLLAWITDLLTGRCQQVKVGSAVSETRTLTSGVIQGSCLGPLLFVLYINDVVEVFSNGIKCKLYADDVKLYTVITTEADSAALQNALDKLHIWSDTWQLNISSTKCSILEVGNKNRYPNVDYFLHNSSVNKANICKDLGVIIDQRLTFTDHISSITTRAHARVRLINKCFISRDRPTLVRAFTTYVRPLLEYASHVWSPYHIADILKIEAVQRRFSKALPGLAALSYSDRLAVLDLESLELRRLHLDLILTYKIIFGLVDVDPTTYFTIRTGYTTRGHSYRITPSNCRVNLRKHYFSNRVCPAWNSLSATDDCFVNLRNFKMFLIRADLSKFLNSQLYS